MKNSIIFIEGSRNVGKTFLIDSIDKDITKYKFPFAKYYNECFSYMSKIQNKIMKHEDINKRAELFYLTIGYDITILDLFKQGIIKEDLIVDRGILSDIIFGIQSGRVSLPEAIEAWFWILDTYGEFFEIIYIKAKHVEDNRNKDVWDIYNQTETNNLYEEFMEIGEVYVNYFTNNFDEDSVINFNKLITSIINEKDQ